MCIQERGNNATLDVSAVASDVTSSEVAPVSETVTRDRPTSRTRQKGTGGKPEQSESGSEPEAPDGGWGWVIVLAAFVLNFLIGGAVNTFGVLYVALLELHHQGSGPTAWVGSMANAMGLLLGPMSSALSARFSCRTMVLVGGVLTAAGWCITGQMPRIEYMFITYGLLAGIGKSLAYTPSIVMVGKWFNRRRSLANGITVAGAGVGTFAFAPLLDALLREYSFSGTMLIMGGVMLNISVCGLLFLPVPSETKKRNGNTLTNDSKDSDSRQTCDAIQEKLDAHVPDKRSYTMVMDPSKEHSDCEQESQKSDEPTPKCNIKMYIDYTLLKNLSFVSFGISVMLATLGHSPASVMLPSLAAQNNIPAQKSAFLLSITGIADIIGRLTFGAICDIDYLKNNRKYMYVASIFISGVANFVCGFARAYWHFATYAVVFGLFAGSYNALTPVILVDLLGAEKLSSSFGLALVFQGLGFLVGPPLAGLISDAMGGYQAAFFFAGIAMVLSALIMNTSSIKPCLKRCTEHLHRGSINDDIKPMTNMGGRPVCISYVSHTEPLGQCNLSIVEKGQDNIGYAFL